jgi:hypothetical protein
VPPSYQLNRFLGVRINHCITRCATRLIRVPSTYTFFKIRSELGIPPRTALVRSELPNISAFIRLSPGKIYLYHIVKFRGRLHSGYVIAECSDARSALGVSTCQGSHQNRALFRSKLFQHQSIMIQHYLPLFFPRGIGRNRLIGQGRLNLAEEPGF